MLFDSTFPPSLVYWLLTCWNTSCFQKIWKRFLIDFHVLNNFCRIIFGLMFISGIEYLHIVIPFKKYFTYLRIAFSTVLIPYCLFVIFYCNEYYLFSLLPSDFLRTKTQKKLIWFCVLFNFLLCMSLCMCSSFWRVNTAIVNLAFFPHLLQAFEPKYIWPLFQMSSIVMVLVLRLF